MLNYTHGLVYFIRKDNFDGFNELFLLLSLCKTTEMKTGTLNLPITYDQIIRLVKRLPAEQKIRLGQELAKEVVDEELSKLLSVFKNEEISEELINQEVETVRADLYGRKKRK